MPGTCVPQTITQAYVNLNTTAEQEKYYIGTGWILLSDVFVDTDIVPISFSCMSSALCALVLTFN